MNNNDIRKYLNFLKSEEEKLLENILSEFDIKEVFTFDNDIISEDVKNIKPFETDNWDVDYSVAFKKGMKKHKKNPRVLSELKELEDWIIEQENKPKIDSLPAKYNAHLLKHEPFSGATSTHIMGKKIIAIFYTENAEPKNKLRWIFVGTHQEANPRWS